ncbi:SMP-30/gluconolactonase/LRE family protein [Anthocerotibacter panamensis]|uniref:SMP-30/gluconolactonase/LRE family protein n=1 Tax=Anthocerotibacter panamensis TaxID=2857077 RepID=UPI001C407F01|nr:hypothetical protein [Anthocerotibacter panamensis]
MALFAQTLIAVGLLLLAIVVIVRPGSMPRFVGRVPASLAFRIPFAVLSALAGAGMLVGLAVPFVVFFAACLTAIVLVWAWPVLVVRGGGSWALPVSMLAATVGVALAQPLGLKVLLLPKADTLSYEPVPASVVKTYDEGVGFESVRAGLDGTLYLAANRGLDFNISDYYRHAQGEIIARSPDGRERIVFTTPVGSTAGVMTLKADGTIFMTSNGKTPGIWRIAPNGAASMIARLPSGAWPNGLDFGPDGMLYTPDSSLAAIWRIDPETGRFEQASDDKVLTARPFIALAPGANGLHFVGRDMIVTVSDSTKVLKFTLGENGTFGRPAILANGIPGDDFAVGEDGSLFITTHPYDTVVRVAPDGRRSIIADARQHIVGATDAVFGRGRHDRDTLYVATDGGAFTKGLRARGQLIALRPNPGR